MNCEQWQQKALLAETGELSDSDRRALDAHMAGCRTCRDFRTASANLACAVRPVLRRGDPSPATLAAIGGEAAAAAARRRPLFLRPLALRFAACAAALALVAGGWLFLRPDATPDPDGIHQVGSLLTMVSEEHAGDSGVPPASTSDNDARLRALAKELLRMEGLAVDEVL